MISLIGDTYGFMVSCPECDWRLVEYIPEIALDAAKGDIEEYLEAKFTRDYYWHYGVSHLGKPSIRRDKVPVNIPHFGKH